MTPEEHGRFFRDRPFNGRYRQARIQRFEARNSAAARAANKKARKAARKARKQ